ncbi:MAG: DUF2062 domain-containing protein [Chitinophagales bacterium]
MNRTGAIDDKMEALGAVVLLPTYNNAAKLPAVLEDILNYTHHILVVNDGSTDNTRQILKKYPDLEILHFGQNQGKGMALRKGFEKALELGYRYAISIDSDGQHLAKDMPVFLDKIEENPGVLLVGARNMLQENVPGTSSFGHKFSNFWYRIETGIDLPDTQSGYRLYPIEQLSKMRFFTSKYEFEIEVLVRAAWAGIKVLPVPIEVYYPPQEERISHFRKVPDFTRISILNTVLVLLAFLFVRPWQFIRSFQKKNIRQLVKTHLFNPEESAEKKAVSVGFGVFMGIVPIWGYQLAAALLLGHFLKLNKAIVAIAANISIPPNIPWIIFLSFKMGGLFVESPADIDYNAEFQLSNLQNIVQTHLLQYALGSCLFAVLMGLALGFVAYVFASVKTQHKTM